MSEALLTIHAVTYGHASHELPLFLHSCALQTDKRFKVVVWHDGNGSREDDSASQQSFFDTANIVGEFIANTKLNLWVKANNRRSNVWGHDMREASIAVTKTKYWNCQNADNYLTPRFVELFLKEMEGYDLEFAWCDILHNYAGAAFGRGPYTVLDSHPKMNYIDIANWVIRTDLIQQFGFPYRTRAADGEFIDNLMRQHPSIRKRKIESCLLVHN